MKNSKKEKVLKGDYPHPMTNMDKEHFCDYANGVMSMKEDEYNKNSCNKERDKENPYATFKLVEPNDVWGTHAEVRVLKCWGSPKTFLDNKSTLRVLTCIKSEATHGTWEYGDMDWLALGMLIIDGKLVEIQRDVEWSLYEFRGVLQKCIEEAKVSPKRAYYMVSSQLYRLVEEGKKNNLSYDELRDVAIKSTTKLQDSRDIIDDIQKEKGEHRVAFGYTSGNKMINTILEDVSDMFEGSSDDEVGFVLTFLARVMDKVKREQAKQSDTHEDFISRGQATGVIELMFAIMEESKVLESKTEEFMKLTQQAKGGNAYGNDEIPKA